MSCYLHMKKFATMWPMPAPIRASILPARAAFWGAVAVAVALWAAPAPASAEIWPTNQVVSANAAFLAHAPPPAEPGVVCLVDSGVNLTPDTAGILVGREAMDGGPGDDFGGPHGHGTRMAMIAAAPANGWGMIGLAPNAVRVYSVRAISQKGTSFPFGDYRKAIRRCLERRTTDASLRVINLSFGGYRTPSRDSIDEFASEAATARRSGVSIVGAAGNAQGPVTYPARHPTVLAVTGMDRNRGLCASVASTGRIDLLAPGCDVHVALMSTGMPALTGGTSDAAVFASAALTALRAYRPDLTPEQAERLLTSTAVQRRLDVRAAFMAAGLSKVVAAGEAAYMSAHPAPSAPPPTPAPQPPAAPAPASAPAPQPQLSAPVPARTRATRRLPRPRIASVRWRRGRLVVRVSRRPRRAVLELRVYRRSANRDFESRRVATVRRRRSRVAISVPRRVDFALLRYRDARRATRPSMLRRVRVPRRAGRRAPARRVDTGRARR